MTGLWQERHGVDIPNSRVTMQLFHEDYVIIISIVGSALTAAHLFYSIKIAIRRQELAYAGDAAAAKRIILPCYKPLVRGILLFYLLFSVALSLTFVNPDLDVHRLVQYYAFSLLTVYSITPVMLVQTSVSAAAFWRTFYTILPYWALNTLVFGLVDVGGTTARICRILFIISATLPPLILSVGILTKRISSRVQLGSNSNRNSTELLLIYSLVFGCVFSAGMGCGDAMGDTGATLHSSADQNDCGAICDVTMVVLTFFLNQLFPFALYRTLLADTKFWRGLGKHNQGGIMVDDALRATGVNLHRPTMELAVASTTLQSALAEIHDLTVDFAFLALEQEVGQGATARVFRGRYKKKVVAVKLSTPPEITEEVLETFLKEAKISALFRHRNIVRFIGICVRPPQIGMVFEFCDGGALKSHLQRHPQLWNPPLQRLRGCLDMARAVQALHQLGFLHRDIKADNFFVGRKLVVKLGDFGEARRIPTQRLQQLRQQQQQQPGGAASASTSSSSGYHEYLRRTVFSGARDSESHLSSDDPFGTGDGDDDDEALDGDAGDRPSVSASKRMTILGTVAFMAPELVNNARVYSEKIDIYALGVAFWELWTLGSDPYADASTFQIYAKVQKGERPSLPDDAPLAFQELLTACWAEEEESRPSATQLVMRLQTVIHGLQANGGTADDADVSAQDAAELDFAGDDDDGSLDAPRETGFFANVFRLSQRVHSPSTATAAAAATTKEPSTASVSTASVSSAGRRGSFLMSLQAAARTTSSASASAAADGDSAIKAGDMVEMVSPAIADTTSPIHEELSDE